MRVRDSLSWPAYSRSKLPVQGAFFNDSCKPASLLLAFSPLGSSLPNIATLTNGVTAFVSVKQSDGRAQGCVWVALDSLQFTDGIVDVVCRKSVQYIVWPWGSRHTTQDSRWSLPAFHTLNPGTG